LVGGMVGKKISKKKKKKQPKTKKKKKQIYLMAGFFWKDIYIYDNSCLCMKVQYK
jgi:hypothetical protein